MRSIQFSQVMFPHSVATFTKECRKLLTYSCPALQLPDSFFESIEKEAFSKSDFVEMVLVVYPDDKTAVCMERNPQDASNFRTISFHGKGLAGYG